MIKKSFVCLLLLLLVGCSGNADDIGIVARVNGAPIYLSQLEFQYDQSQSDSVMAVPSVEKLKAEYGDILTELIVQELVVQELKRQEISVSEHDLLKAEEEVRADYPEGAFDQMLIEECIDLKAWRLQLRNYLAMKKFYHLVLRPQIKIDYKEAQEYYREHISDFYLPESLRVLVVRGPSREIVERAVKKYLTEKDQVNLATVFGEVETREVVVRESRLSAAWKSALAGLQPGQSSGVQTDRFGFEALVLQERSPAKVLAPAQAYPLVEKALLESKLQDAFAKWLTQALASAKITETSHLLPSPNADVEELDPEESEHLSTIEPKEEQVQEPTVLPLDVPDDANGTGI
ncbi:peptidyl-prolyl cis-trans isomerase [Pseudodesulfovibrio sp.]|uniref:peptidylprolyl isomerase n=1 Tax=unclassified Pseudodesulfovibrio TaxID=2661612 RepID=UPI003AFFD299